MHVRLVRCHGEGTQRKLPVVLEAEEADDAADGSREEGEDEVEETKRYLSADADNHTNTSCLPVAYSITQTRQYTNHQSPKVD